jgi:3-oxoacyl-[acyl-carrier-protein] synthase-3
MKTVGVAGIAYALPDTICTVRELAASGLVQSDAGLLQRFGFERVCISTTQSPFDLALRAAAQVLQDVDPASVGLLVYAGPQGPTAFSVAPTSAESSASHRTTARFRFPATRLQHELDLTHAGVLGVDQGACTNLLAAVRTARAFCIAEGIERALCIASEFFPADAGREALFNCTSDAAVAVLVEADAERNRIVATTHLTKGYYWDAEVLRNEIVASYFPTARHVIERTAAAAGWSLEDIDWIIPHNVSRRSWDVLMGLLRIPCERLWAHNIARVGHTLAGDNFINLADALADGSVRPGHKLVLFSYGYGAHWTALAVEA